MDTTNKNDKILLSYDIIVGVIASIILIIIFIGLLINIGIHQQYTDVNASLAGVWVALVAYIIAYVYLDLDGVDLEEPKELQLY